jgi:hypothetical protein
MRTRQFESGIIVVKCGRLPGGGGMTKFTARTIRTIMPVIFLMTGHTGVWRVLKLERCSMAILAGNSGMLAIQSKYTFVFESGWFPAIACMAGLAFGAFAAGVFIIFLMAAIAGVRSIFVLIRDGVTLFASGFLVLANQGETGHCMVKMGILPAILGMTGITSCAKVFPMWVNFLVTIHAFGRQRFKIGQQARACMAFDTR